MRLLNAFAGFCLLLATAATTTVSAQCPPDTDAPVITDMPADITQTAEPGVCGATISWTIPTATDNCEVTSFSANQVPNDFYSVGITTVTYTAMDAEGNVSAASFTITITDDEDPSISDMPADISVNNDTGSCSAIVTWDAPTADDNCGIASLTSTHDSGDPFAVGTTTVTYTATDVNGGIITDSFDVTVTDNEAPSAAASDLTLVLDATGAASTTAAAVNNGSSDNCSIATIDLSQTDFNCTHLGTNTVTLTVTDIHSNQSTATATITVQDNQAPVIAQMADLSATNDANNCSAVVTWTDPAVTDNCTYTLTPDIASGTAFDVGVTTVTYSVTDAGGNTDSMSFDVTVTDTQGPTISGTPSDITQAKDAGSCDAVVTWTAPTATDNCTLATLGSDINSGTTFDLGPTTVTYTAIDIYGNTTTDSFTVTITDSDYDGDLDGDCTDPDIDGDGALNAADSDDFNENVCSDVDMDGCDDCSSGSYDPANDGTDFDGDGLCDLGDPDDDNDGALDGADSDDNNANVCSDTDMDGCDDCSGGTYAPANDGFDYDGDGLCDLGDPDDDNDGALDGADSDDNDNTVCSDTDMDGCDDCSSGSYDPSNDGFDYDGDGLCDLGDPDDDNDGALDGADSDDNNANVCSDTDMDGCDDCSSGSYAPANDGLDYDGDGLCDLGDPDDDNDGALDGADSDDNDNTVCSDTDMDGCDDCSSGSYDPNNDGFDFDGDGLCDLGDPDDDNDGALDGADSDDNNANVCSDTDMDGCDDCSSGSYAPNNDGTDFDGDGLCDLGDPDDDNDGALDGADSDDNNANVCSDTDMDGCDDCSSGSYDPANDGFDYDGDGLCDLGDPDDDNDGALDGADSDDNDATVCSDTDMDGCDDCSGGSYAPANDGFDYDGDGLCDLGDPDDDNDGALDGADSDDNDNTVCSDTDMDGCDDCSSGSYDPANDGFDYDGDGLCDLGDPDDDNDGALDGADSDDNNANVCSDDDMDGCDECSSGSYVSPANDGFDYDGDGLCDVGDPDDDNDGALDGADSDDNNANVCSDTDMDGCDDCSSGSYDPANDGTDFDGDGLCDLGDPDDDNDGALDGADSDDNDANVCSDTDMDGCDDCSSGTYAPNNDGTDFDGDGLCDLGDPDDDNDGALDGVDSDDNDATVCSDTDMDGCDDCSGGSYDPANDGFDYDGDGLCDLGDPDDDNDGVNGADIDGTCDTDFSCGNPFTYNGYNYATVSSGTDCVFAENLNTMYYLNGDPIQTGLSNASWSSTTEGAVHVRPGTESTTYGHQYNYMAVTDARGLCPSGWGVGTTDDWRNMALTSGGTDLGFDIDNITGMKSVDLWLSNPGTNTSGLNIRPGAFKENDGTDNTVGYSGAHWTSDGYIAQFNSFGQILDLYSASSWGGNRGCSIRCLAPMGCTNPAASNYNAQAVVCDGSCEAILEADSDDNNANVCLDTDMDGCDDCSSGSYDPANDGFDYDGDGLCDLGDPDDDNDGALDGADSDDNNANVCSDADMDGCDECSSGSYVSPANDGFDYDGDGLCDVGDPDDDNDGALDGADSDDNNANVCSDTDMDGCDDCSSGSYDPANDGTDFDGDGLCDLGDPDDDNDGALDAADSDDNDANVCSDTDMDGCDDCSSGTYAPNNDGTDFDGDGLCDLGDPDDDNDGALDGADSDDNNANVCSDTDMDGCDDCSGGSYDPANDGFDYDGDGLCDLGDPDDDNDGALDGADSDDNNANVCSDTDMDGCDDCSNGSYAPANDGFDYDGDGLCDLGDPDDDNDGVLDGADSDDNDNTVCSDADMDGCDDCSSGSYDPANDGFDFDGDGLCDLGDPDDDNDGALDAADSDDNNANVCSDTDMDGCDDCSGGSYDPSNDGTDTDGDGICDLGDNCSDPLANNYLDPANGECEDCPNAPIFDSIYYTVAATTLSSADGAIALDISGNAASTLYLTGINGASDYTIALPDDLNDLEAGYYIARVQDSDGCWGVADTSVGGTTLQQPAIQLEVIIPFTLCCSGCGINDIDADGLCDDDDNCTDQRATNFEDSANGPCIIPGCTDSNFTEYDAAATQDDGSCATAVVEGCTNPAADNYDATANTDDGSCIIPSCDTDADSDGLCDDVDLCWFTGACNYDYNTYGNVACIVPDAGACETCSGGVAVGDNTPPTVLAVTWPADYTTTGICGFGTCEAATAANSANAGIPTGVTWDDDCGVGSNDQTFTDGPQYDIVTDDAPYCGFPCNGYSFDRTWTITATDNAGNTASQTHVQTITVTVPE